MGRVWIFEPCLLQSLLWVPSASPFWPEFHSRGTERNNEFGGQSVDLESSKFDILLHFVSFFSLVLTQSLTGCCAKLTGAWSCSQVTGHLEKWVTTQCVLVAQQAEGLHRTMPHVLQPGGESSQGRRGGRCPSKERDNVVWKAWRQEGTQHSEGETTHPGKFGKTKWTEGVITEDDGHKTKWKGHFEPCYGDLWRTLEAETPIKMGASACERTEGIRDEVKRWIQKIFQLSNPQGLETDCKRGEEGEMGANESEGFS